MQKNAVYASLILRYLIKNYIGHTVATQVDELKALPITIKESSQIMSCVQSIIKNQKQNPRYDYMSNEQQEIDKLVYEMYGLNEDDIKEVETWYARRYPKLAGFLDID